MQTELTKHPLENVYPIFVQIDRCYEHSLTNSIVRPKNETKEKNDSHHKNCTAEQISRGDTLFLNENEFYRALFYNTGKCHSEPSSRYSFKSHVWDGYKGLHCGSDEPNKVRVFQEARFIFRRAVNDKTKSTQEYLSSVDYTIVTAYPTKESIVPEGNNLQKRVTVEKKHVQDIESQ